MNKNTIMAFLIIFISVIIFTHPKYNKFFNEKILGKKYEQKNIIEKIDRKITNYKTIKEKKEEEKKEIIQEKIVEKKQDTIWIENEKFIVGIQQKGATIISIKMKEYQENGRNIEILGVEREGGANLKIGNTNYDKKIFKYNGEKKKIEIKQKKQKIEFEYYIDSLNKISKIYEFIKDEYKINVIIKNNSLSGERITFGWKSGIEESEKITKKNQMISKVIHIYDGNSTQHFELKKKDKEEITGRIKWVGITSKYFFISINNDEIEDSDISIVMRNQKKENKKEYELEICRTAEENEEKFSIFAGPTKREILKKYENKYESIIFPVIGWGKIFFWSEKWFPWLADKVLLLLIIIQKIVKDYGIAIIILTIITKLITYPLTLSSMKSMEKMKDIQPKVNAIRQKHKNNPQKMNEEVMALYKKEGVNPLNPGCLPMFLQMPVLFSLFVVLRKAIEIRGAKTILIPWINDLSQPEILISLEKIIPNGIPLYGSNIALLPIIMAVVTFIQQKMTIKDPNQKAMIYFMPVFMLVLFNSFPSGLVLYWTFSSTLQLVQQLLMNRNKIKR